MKNTGVYPVCMFYVIYQYITVCVCALCCPQCPPAVLLWGTGWCKYPTHHSAWPISTSFCRRTLSHSPRCPASLHLAWCVKACPICPICPICPLSSPNCPSEFSSTTSASSTDSSLGRKPKTPGPFLSSCRQLPYCFLFIFYCPLLAPWTFPAYHWFPDSHLPFISPIQPYLPHFTCDYPSGLLARFPGFRALSSALLYCTVLMLLSQQWMDTNVAFSLRCVLRMSWRRKYSNQGNDWMFPYPTTLAVG